MTGCRTDAVCSASQTVSIARCAICARVYVESLYYFFSVCTLRSLKVSHTLMPWVRCFFSAEQKSDRERQRDTERLWRYWTLAECYGRNSVFFQPCISLQLPLSMSVGEMACLQRNAKCQKVSKSFKNSANRAASTRFLDAQPKNPHISDRGHLTGKKKV